MILDNLVLRFTTRKVGLTDYKVHNFNGEPKFILVCKNRFEGEGITEDFYSIDWEHLDLKRPNARLSNIDLNFLKNYYSINLLGQKAIGKSLQY